MKTTVREVLTFLGLDEPGRRDSPLVRAGPPTDVSNSTLTLVRRKGESLSELFGNGAADVLIFALASLRQQSDSLPQVFLFSDNPRLMFCRVLNRFFSELLFPQIAGSAVIRTSKPLNRLVRIGDTWLPFTARDEDVRPRLLRFRVPTSGQDLGAVP